MDDGLRVENPDVLKKFRLGNRLYVIRLAFARSDYGDAVITLTFGGRTQNLFDAEPTSTLYGIGMSSVRRGSLMGSCEDRRSISVP